MNKNKGFTLIELMIVLTIAGIFLAILFGGYTRYGMGAHPERVSSDTTMKRQQEQAMSEAVAQTGIPAIKNFRERKILKDILELRDQAGLVTYTYTYSEMTGKKIFLCQSVGYPIPYSTQFTNPEKTEIYRDAYGWGNVTVPQADPNGLFSPASADASWVLCKDPNGDQVKPIYVEPKLITSPFKIAE